MEAVSVIGKSHVKIGGGELGSRELGILSSRFDSRSFASKAKNGFSRSLGWESARIGCSSNAVQKEAVRSETVSSFSRTSKSSDGVRLYVGLPLDAVTTCNTIKHSRAIAISLKALKLLGVEGVELSVWWGIAEREAMGKFEWSNYFALAEMVQNAGLKLHVSLCFHASKQPRIPLPDWVSQIGESQPAIYFMDRSGQRYKDCLSLAVDDLPVLNGRTPIQVYHQFCESFKASFSHLMGSTIKGISMGLGPDGELRYPSQQSLKLLNGGIGEFQCYDENMLSLLKQHSEAAGNPLWGLGGPHDAPKYNDSPNGFFNENGGSWESPYGDFFLSWYSNQLIAHGDRLLSLASSTFDESIYAKIPLSHSWYKTRSHPSELTAGFYNTALRDGYEGVAEMFARNSCKMILPGMDLSDAKQPKECLSSPESLLSQIIESCRKHGVKVLGQNSSGLGQNSSGLGLSGGFEQIKNNLSGENAIRLFTYQRVGAYFFSPEHFPSFIGFVRSTNQPKQELDDLPIESESISMSSESVLQVQGS